MYCSKCGRKIEEGSLFCDNCGERITLNKTNVTSKDSLNNKNRLFLKKCIIGFIIFLLGFLIYTTIGRKYLVKKYYDKGNQAYLEFLRYTNNGMDLGGEDNIDGVKSIIDEIDHNYSKCLKFAGGKYYKYDINYDAVKNCSDILYSYID